MTFSRTNPKGDFRAPRRQASFLAVLLAGLLWLVVAAAGQDDLRPATASAPRACRFTVLHTNDLHSAFEGQGPDAAFTPQAGDGDPVVGHFARLATLINGLRRERQARGEPVLTLDAGDQAFGTLFHALAPSARSPLSPEWEFLHRCGYDAVAVGNHAFEAGENGLLFTLWKARQQGWRVPLLAGNIRFHPGSEALESLTLNDLQGRGTGFLPFLVRELPAPPLGERLASVSGTPPLGERLASVSGTPPLGERLASVSGTPPLGERRQTPSLGSVSGPPPGILRVGILGLCGPNAARLCLATRRHLTFDGFDDASGQEQPDRFHLAARALVQMMKKRLGVQIVIALVHAGEPEDEALARAVPDIDLLIAGHTHQRDLRRVGRTWIAQAGWGGAGVGCLDLSWDRGELTLRNPKDWFQAADDRVAADPVWMDRIAVFKSALPAVLEPASFTHDADVCLVREDLPRGRWPDNRAGRFACEILLEEINRRLSPPLDLYLSTFSLVRSDFRTVSGKPVRYRYSDLFRFFPLGYDERGYPGSHVVTCYLARGEVKTLLEAMMSFRGRVPAYEPVLPPVLSFGERFWGIPLVNRLSGMRLGGKDWEELPAFLHVGMSEFFARNLERIGIITKGLVEVIPCDATGIPCPPETPPGLPKEHDLLAAGLAWRESQGTAIASGTR